jgi:molybdopterin-guanine dinucleotide biosynthesis protein
MDAGGTFGPKKSGKTTLAAALCLETYRKQGKKALILDPHTDEWNRWPACAVGFVTANEKQFWDVVWRSRNCMVIVEEAAATISRNRDLIPVFTRLRHCFHTLFVVGHSGMDLLPVMREQIDTLFLFRQPVSAAKVWAEVMTEPRLLEAVNLKQYEFIRHQLFGVPRKLKLPPPA